MQLIKGSQPKQALLKMAEIQIRIFGEMDSVLRSVSDES